VGKPEGKSPPVRPVGGLIDNVDKMELAAIRWNGVVRIFLAQDGEKWKAIVNAVMNLRAAQHSEKWLHNWWPLE
jgi:hypothetical protein